MDKSDLRIEQLQQYLGTFLDKRTVQEIFFYIQGTTLQIAFNVLRRFSGINRLLNGLIILIHITGLIQVIGMPVKEMKIVFSQLLVILFYIAFHNPFLLVKLFEALYPVCRRRSPERSACQEKYQPDVEYGPFPGDGMQTGVTEGPKKLLKQKFSSFFIAFN